MLDKCVYSFERLEKAKYNFVVAKKMNLTEITLNFTKDEFHHIMGFHYLKDLRNSLNSKRLFNDIKANKITLDHLKRSQFFKQVESRILAVPDIIKHLENDNVILKYIEKRNPYSKINADYLIESTIDDKTCCIFLRKRNDKDENTYCVCSFFVKGDTEYIGEKLSWLLKEKVFIESEKKKELFRHSNYQDVFEEVAVTKNNTNRTKGELKK
jgi:hypothetical protein